MEMIVYKNYLGNVCLMQVSQEMYDNGWTTQQVGVRDVPGPVNIPQVALEHQDKIQIYDIPDGNNEFVLRHDYDTGLWGQVKDDNGQPIPITGVITHEHKFLVLDSATLPSQRFFDAWEIDDALLVSGSGTQAHPDFYAETQ